MLDDELAAGLANLRAVFRQQMVRGAHPAETVDQIRARLEADPATKEIADRLECSVCELLEGLGEAETFVVAEDYDHERASAEVDAIMEELTRALAPGDGLDQGEAPKRGEKTAPHVRDPKGRVLGDEESARLIREQRIRAAMGPRR
jgi:hypothetical protein